MTTPAYGVTSYHPTTPYMTTEYFRSQPTGLPSDNLCPWITDARKQDDELARFILKASSEMNTFCFGATGGTLNATSDTEVLYMRMDRMGRFKIHPRFIPVQALTALSFGPDPTLMTSVTDFSAVHIEPDEIIAPAFPFSGMSSQGPLQFGAIASTAYDVRVLFTYINGFALSFTTGALSAAATSATVLDATGMFVGRQMVFRDPVNGDDVVIVSAVSGNTVTFAGTPLAYQHPAGTQLDYLPEDVLESCVEITKGLLKRKAQDTIKPSGPRGGSARGAEDQLAGEDNFAVGFGKLTPYQMVRYR